MTALCATAPERDEGIHPREPALANEELEHRPQRARWPLKDLAIVGERVSGTEKRRWPTYKTDDGALIRLQAPPSQASLAAWDLKALIDAARVKECQAKRPRTRFFVGQLGYIASL